MKIVIACDNDNLLDELLKNAELEVVKIPTNEKNIIDYLNVCCDMLILDFQEETNYDPIVEQIYEVHNKNIVISATEKEFIFALLKISNC